MKLRLREIREKKGLTQEQLGKLINTSNAAVSRLENQDAATMLKLERAAKALGVTVSDFLAERPDGLSELDMLFQDLSQSDQVAVLEMARALARLRGQMTSE